MNCTICKSSTTKLYKNVKDNSVSKESFEVYECESCQNFFTANPPTEEHIGPYYESEDYVSHTDTKTGVIHKLYHLVRNYSLNQKIKLIKSHNNGLDLLDYGCGTGEFLSRAKTHGYNTLGIEPSETASAIANKKGVSTHKPSFLKEIPSNSKDVITLWHVLEHVHQLNETLEEFKRILKPGGNLIIAVPNISSSDSTHYKEHWAALDVPRHLYHFTPKGLVKLVNGSSLSHVDTKGMPFDSFYVSMLSEKYLNKVPMPLQLIKAFIIGLLSNLKAGSNNYSSNIYIFKKL